MITFQREKTRRYAVAVAALLVAALISADSPCVAQMLSRQTHAYDVDRWDSPSTEVAAKERALIQEVLEPELVLRVDPSRSKIVRTKLPVGRIVIGNPDIVDVTEFDPMEFEIVGKQLGETTMSLWFPRPNGNPSVLRYLVQVVGNSSEERRNEVSVRELQNRVNEMFPNSQITLTPIRNRLVVRGQARDSQEARDILSLVGEQFNGRQNNGRQQVNADILGPGSANQTYNQINGAPDDDTQIINLLRIPGVQQVMLKVRVAELTRQSSRELGTDLRGVLGSLSLGSVVDGLDDFTAILDTDDVRLFLRAFASHGYGKMLAEPTLVTVSGQTASFRSGGEFAVPTTVGVGGAEAVSTTFHGFGTELEFTPTVIDKDLIRLQVNPSFSSLNDAASVNGIPGLNRRSVQTTVELREGQWLAIAGLIQDEQGGNRSRLPYLGDLPTIGGLFGKQATTRNETELIILVSPELVHPMEAEQVPLQLPGMEITDPTDEDVFRRNMTEGFAGHHHRSTVWPEMDNQLQEAIRGSRLLRNRVQCQRQYVSGPCGFSQ